jgi:hypothetical protein
MLSLEDEAISKIDEMAKEHGMDRSKFIIYMADFFVQNKKKDRRVILPVNTLGKDELAKLLGIGPLEKEWSLFMDRIYTAKVYDPDKIISKGM